MEISKKEQKRIKQLHKLWKIAKWTLFFATLVLWLLIFIYSIYNLSNPAYLVYKDGIPLVWVNNHHIKNIAGSGSLSDDLRIVRTLSIPMLVIIFGAIGTVLTYVFKAKNNKLLIGAFAIIVPIIALSVFGLCIMWLKPLWLSSYWNNTLHKAVLSYVYPVYSMWLAPVIPVEVLMIGSTAVLMNKKLFNKMVESEIKNENKQNTEQYW